MKIDQKIIGRFQQLIDFEAGLMNTLKEGGGSSMYDPPYKYVSKEQANQWGVSCLHILKRVFGEESDHYTKFNDYFPKFSGNSNYYSIKSALGILRAAKDDYESGYLFDTRTLIEAEVFDDLLEQAEHLLANGYFAPAAVIAGSVLEDGLRKLCQRHSVIVPAKPKLDSMNSELVKVGAYNTLAQKRITALADIRNKAAHGRWGEFAQSDVEQMIAQVRTFMEDHFS